MLNLFEAWYRIGFQISGLIFKSCFFIFLRKKKEIKECRFLKYVKSTNKTEKLLKKINIGIQIPKNHSYSQYMFSYNYNAILTCNL